MPLRLGNAVQIGIKVEIFEDAEILVEPEFLRHIADAILHLLRMGDDVHSDYGERAFVRLHQAGSEAQEGGLAASIRSDQGRELALFNFDADAVEGMHDLTRVTAKCLAEILT